MDRFRDRFSMAGAKDGSRDAEVMSSLVAQRSQMLPTACAGRPVIVELREWSRIAEELGVERTRLANRPRFRPSSNSRATLAPEWLLVAQTAADSSSRRVYDLEDPARAATAPRAGNYRVRQRPCRVADPATAAPQPTKS